MRRFSDVGHPPCFLPPRPAGTGNGTSKEPLVYNVSRPSDRGDIYEILPLGRRLRLGAGHRNFNCGYFSYGLSPVSCGISADRLRLRLYAPVRKGACYEDRRCEITEVFEWDLKENLQNERIIPPGFLIDCNQ